MLGFLGGYLVIGLFCGVAISKSVFGQMQALPLKLKWAIAIPLAITLVFTWLLWLPAIAMIEGADGG